MHRHAYMCTVVIYTRTHSGLPVGSGQAGWHGAGLQKGGWLVHGHTETQTNQTRKQTNNHTNETVSKQTNDKTINQKINDAAALDGNNKRNFCFL